MNRSLLLLLIFVPLAVADERPPVKKAQPEAAAREEWFPLPQVPNNPTRAAISIWREIDIHSRKPVNRLDQLSCKIEDIRISFHLEKNEFLLGEPILVEYRMALEGPGEWKHFYGGNYRARGRDDNFLFLMRRTDGSWVRDPEAPVRGYMGGMVGSVEVKQGESKSMWQAVQRWCSIEEPGTYDLFCFRTANDFPLDSDLIDPRFGKGHREFEWIHNNSPLLKHIPAILEEPAKHWFIKSTSAYANFRITIRKGTAEEQKAMAKRWIEITKGAENARSVLPGHTRAASQGIRYSLDDAFLDRIETNIDDPNINNRDDYRALALRSTPDSLEILFRHRTEAALWAYSYLKPSAIPRAIPLLIDALTDQRPRVRAVAELQLTRFTKMEFLRTWGGGYDCSRPTIEEARKMQPLWRKWWEENKATFKVSK